MIAGTLAPYSARTARDHGRRLAIDGLNHAYDNPYNGEVVTGRRAVGLLSGYRVLDLTDERGLLAGRMLADLGADVVVVEPLAGSRARHAAPLSDRDGQPYSYVWATFAANNWL